MDTSNFEKFREGYISTGAMDENIDDAFECATQIKAEKGCTWFAMGIIMGNYEQYRYHD